MRQSLIRKLAISVTTNIEPEVNWVAGFPTSPRAAIARTEVLAMPRRGGKTVSLMTEGTVPLAIAEGAREEVEQLSRKFGADSAFIAGLAYELDSSLEKEAFMKWLRARLKPKAEIVSMRVHEKPIAMSQPIRRSVEPGAEYARLEPRIRAIEARRAKGKLEPGQAQ